ncbi:MAG TPA: GNAT family N-acetyltransferase [Dehalococcoidia bacterium]|nr:GNAT family N-acetyltransferase [Dehalococcoidia bacterium]
MTVVERKGAARDLWTEYAVRRLESRDHIRALLETRRPYAAYALGQLEPALFRQTEWWRASTGGREALVLHSRGGLGHATFTMGEAGALDAALRVHPGGRHTFLTCEPHHLETVLRHFDLDQRQTMIRMQVSRDTFRASKGSVRRLTGMDAREINRLYRVDGVPSYYSPRQIDDAVYFGAEIDGHVVAVAGTHVISAASGIAVVGNVYTHPRYRNLKLAQAVTSAVTELLLARCRDIVLSVDPANVPAVAAYERLGYVEVARLIEGAATRRDVLGAETLLRRAIARLRGDRKGEIVRIRAE